MGHGVWVLTVILLLIPFKSLQKELPSTTEYDYNDYYDYYDDSPVTTQAKEDSETARSKYLTTSENSAAETTRVIKHDREGTTTKKQLAKYEVTELVDDIPEVNTKRVPIFTNVTVTKPLNLAGNANNNKVNPFPRNDEGDEVINAIFVSNKPITSTNRPGKSLKDEKSEIGSNINRKCPFGHHCPKSEFDKEFDSENEDYDDNDEFEDIDFKDAPKKTFKDYFHNIGKDIVTGFKSVVHKHKVGIDDSLHKIVHGPILFLSKLHKKTSDLVKDVYKTVSKHKFHYRESDDIDDDYEYYGDFKS